MTYEECSDETWVTHANPEKRFIMSETTRDYSHWLERFYSSVESILSQFTATEAQCVIHVYGLYGEEEKKPQTVAELFDIPIQHVRNAQQQFRRKLSGNLELYLLDQEQRVVFHDEEEREEAPANFGISRRAPYKGEARRES